MSPINGYRARFQDEDSEALAGPAEDRTWTYGTCLYLGPRGQRCQRPALEGGFCARHATDSLGFDIWIWIRRLAGLLVAVALLWPIIEAFLVELSHWRH